MKASLHIFFKFFFFYFCLADDDHCCKEKTVGGKIYKLVKTSENAEDLGCFNNCVYTTPDSISEFCFKRGQDQPICNKPSNNFEYFNSSAGETYVTLETVFAEKTEGFAAQTDYPQYAEKEKWMLEEWEKITNKTIKIEAANIYVNELLKNVPSPKLEKTLNSIQEIAELVQTSENPDQFNQELNNIKNKLLHQTPEYPELHAAIHQGIESARFIFKFIGAEGGALEMIKAVSANTELENREFNIDPCRQSISKGAVGGAVAACVANPTDCNRDASKLAIYGIAIGALPCLPSIKVESDCSSCPSSCECDGTCSICTSSCTCSLGCPACLSDCNCGGDCPVCASDCTCTGDCPVCASDCTCNSGTTHGPCFGTTNQVETLSGLKGISELVIGDFVRTSSGSISTHFTEFLGWLDRSKTAIVPMLKISTSQDYPPLILTRTHIVFTSTTSKYAEDIRQGDKLLQWNGSEMEDLDVTEILPVISNGSWSPLTREGTLLVDGILSSCYASFNHELADLAMSPVKAIPTILLDNEISQHEDGTRSYVKLLKLAGEQIGARERNKKEIPPPTISFFTSFGTHLEL